MVEMLNTSEETIEHLQNFQKTVVEGLKFKSFALSAPSVWVDDPEMYAHLKPQEAHQNEGVNTKHCWYYL
ncbi:hypothetical protein DSO57_1033784 [Entomophthora muscae]|uniref:Uncharacterized protein n=1 Tax=Entomophthora muscae TaxID=34485 RepID=A0ACC2U9H6_9FUNG|nr:hypothetical protein DSO57_1033784 [Entomophthora muscae]